MNAILQQLLEHGTAGAMSAALVYAAGAHDPNALIAAFLAGAANSMKPQTGMTSGVANLFSSKSNG